MYTAEQFKSESKHIQSYLGVALVASVALFVGYVVKDALEEFSTNIVPAAGAIDTTGTLTIASPEPLHYGNLLQFRTSYSGSIEGATSYVTTVCFQGEQLVYQLSAKPNVKFLLTDPIEPGFEWDGGAASCSASLIYRVPKDGGADLYMLDSVTFDVEPRK